jgi:hypothetical protein
MSHDTTRRVALIGNNFQITTFAHLPVEHQLAVAWYMAVDNDAWSDTFGATQNKPEFDRRDPASMAEFATHLPQFIKNHGTVPFGLNTITAQQAKQSLQHDAEALGVRLSFAEIHAEYLRNGDFPTYSDDKRWPVILGNGASATFQDGYERLHSYLRDGHETIPMVFFPDRKHLQLLVRESLPA